MRQWQIIAPHLQIKIDNGGYKRRPSVYPGNSPGKEEARQLLYQRAIDKVGKEKFFKLKHIVVSSWDCGDIKYLFSIGVLRSNIIACDILESARKAAAVFQVIVSPKPDIIDTVEWAVKEYGREDIATINVDLCHTLILGVPILRKVLRHTPIECAVLYTYVRGRADRMRGEEERLRYLSEHIDANIYRHNYRSKCMMTASILISSERSWLKQYQSIWAWSPPSPPSQLTPKIVEQSKRYDATKPNKRTRSMPVEKALLSLLVVKRAILNKRSVAITIEQAQTDTGKSRKAIIEAVEASEMLSIYQCQDMSNALFVIAKDDLSWTDNRWKQ